MITITASDLEMQYMSAQMVECNLIVKLPHLTEFGLVQSEGWEIYLCLRCDNWNGN